MALLRKAKSAFGLDPDQGVEAPRPPTPQAPTPTLNAPQPTTPTALGGLDPDAGGSTAPTTDPKLDTSAQSVEKNLAAQGTYGSSLNTGYQEKEQDVGDVASDMMKTDSLLMQQAAADGLQASNERGLANSSMAVTASQDAMLQHIVPMASQTAGQNFQQNLSYQEAGQASALSSQDTAESSMLAEQGFHQSQKLSYQDFEQSSALSRQDFQQTSELSEQEFQQTSKLSEQEYNQQLGLAQQQYSFDRDLMELDYEQQSNLMEQGFDYEMQLQQSEQEFQKEVASMELSAQQHADAQDAVNEVWNNYQEQYFSIMSNPDLSKQQREKQLNEAEELATSQIQTIDATYGTDYDTTLKFY